MDPQTVQALLSAALDPQTIEALISAGSTLVAAFAGSWFAFYLADKDQDRKLKRDQAGAGNRALFVLLRQLNALVNIQRAVINPFRDDPFRYMSMRALLPQTHDDLRIDLDSLGFLLETKHVNIVGDLMVVDQRFRIAIDTLNERSRLHLQEAQPLFAAAGLQEQEEGLPADLEGKLLAAFGEPLFLRMQRASEQMILTVDDTVESVEKMSAALHVVLKELFPDRKFLKFVAAPGDKTTTQPTMLDRVERDRYPRHR